MIYTSEMLLAKDIISEKEDSFRSLGRFMQFTEKGVVATDGISLMAVEGENTENKTPFVVAIDNLKSVKPLYDNQIIMEKDKKSIKITTKEGEIKVPKEKVEYPKWKKLTIPKKKDLKAEFTINPMFLEKMAKTIKRMQNGSKKVKISFYGERSAIKFTATSQRNDKIIGLIMPIVE